MKIFGSSVKEQIFDFLNQAEIAFAAKEQIFQAAENAQGRPEILISELQAMEIPEDLRGAVMELVGAYVERESR